MAPGFRCGHPRTQSRPEQARLSLSYGIARSTLWWHQPEVRPGRRRGNTAPRGAGEQSFAYEEGFSDLLDRLALLPDGDGECGKSHRPAPEQFEQGLEYRPVETVQPLASTSYTARAAPATSRVITPSVLTWA